MSEIKSKLINAVIGNQFPITEDMTVVAVQSYGQKSYNQIKEEGKLSEEDIKALVEVKYNVQEYVKDQILSGAVVVTTIECYDTCAYGFKTLREATSPTGGLIILGSRAELNSSKLITVIQGTPRCFFVEINSQKGSDEEEKAITEEYNSYKEAYKLRKEENPDLDEEKQIRVSAASRLNMLKWKFIADISDMALIFDINYRGAVSKNNYLVRNTFCTGAPAYVYVGRNKPKEAVDLIKPASYAFEVPVFKDTDLVDYSLTEFTNILLGEKEKVKYEPTHLFTTVDSDALLGSVDEDFAVTGLINQASKDKIQVIYASAYTDEYIAAYLEEHPDTKRAWSLVKDKLSLLRSDVLKEQLQTLIETSLESDKTVMVVADTNFGVSPLYEAYKALTRQKNTPIGQLVILVGEVKDTFEGSIMSTLLSELEKFPNVGFITANRGAYKVTIPNTKPVEERKEGEKDTVNITLPAYAALAYISSSLAGEVISISDTGISVDAKYPRYYAFLAGTDYQDYRLRNPKDTFFSRKPNPKVTESARMEAIKDVVNITEYKSLFKEGMKMRVDSGVKSF